MHCTNKNQIHLSLVHGTNKNQKHWCTINPTPSTHITGIKVIA
jgi:hypothetical protein